jgi:hypothetical protein
MTRHGILLPIATTLCSLTNNTYVTDMEHLGLVDIAPVLLAEMKKGSAKN